MRRRPPRPRCELSPAGNLADHRSGAASAQGQQAQRKIARDLDGCTADSERKRQAEVRIARYAGEYLDPAGDELLHQECAVRRLRVERREAVAQLHEGVAKIVLGLQVCRDETKL